MGKTQSRGRQEAATYTSDGTHNPRAVAGMQDATGAFKLLLFGVDQMNHADEMRS